MYTPYIGKIRVSNLYNMPTHAGVDLVGYTSKDIYAVAGGTVEVADNAGTLDPNGYGCYVRIKVDGLATDTWDYYGHLVKGSIVVKVGTHIKKGDKLGVEGTTGNSTGNHLHFERRVGSRNRASAVNAADVLGILNKTDIFITDTSKDSLTTPTTEKILITQAQHEIIAIKTVEADKLASELAVVKKLGYTVTSKETAKAVYEDRIVTEEIKVDDKIKLTGYLYASASGSGKGQYRSGTIHTVTRIADGVAAYLLDGGLGWVRAQDIIKV